MPLPALLVPCFRQGCSRQCSGSKGLRSVNPIRLKHGSELSEKRCDCRSRPLLSHPAGLHTTALPSCHSSAWARSWPFHSSERALGRRAASTTRPTYQVGSSPPPLCTMGAWTTPSVVAGAFATRSRATDHRRGSVAQISCSAARLYDRLWEGNMLIRGSYHQRAMGPPSSPSTLFPRWA